MSGELWWLETVFNYCMSYIVETLLHYLFLLLNEMRRHLGDLGCLDITLEEIFIALEQTFVRLA